jgi:hypothetical protein
LRQRLSDRLGLNRLLLHEDQLVLLRLSHQSSLSDLLVRLMGRLGQMRLSRQ